MVRIMKLNNQKCTSLNQIPNTKKIFMNTAAPMVFNGTQWGNQYIQHINNINFQTMKRKKIKNRPQCNHNTLNQSF